MKLRKCPFCGGVAELTFKMPVYGAGGCEIKCISCRAKVHDFGYTEQHLDMEKGTISTPATIESISGCIDRAIEKWNRRVGDELVERMDNNESKNDG